jgi:hypothetical protein
MQTPFFYIIKHIKSQTYYAGCKINSKADSSTFMTKTGYQTSSNIIKNLINSEGLESFIVVRLKHFNNSKEALQYESKFLVKVKAAENEKFFNKHNGGINFVNCGGYKLSESTKQKMKKPKSRETVERQNYEKRNRDKESYRKMVETRKIKYTTWHTDEQIEKIKIHNANWWTEDNRKKHSEIMKEVYRQNPVSEETKQKHRENSKGSNNGMYGKIHSESTKEKLRLAWVKRKEDLAKNKN